METTTDNKADCYEVDQQPTPGTDIASGSAPQFIGLNEHKAGLDGLDKEKINKIIQEASKGSNFYLFQQKRQKRIDKQIESLRRRFEAINETQLQNFLVKADTVLASLENRRLLNRIVVHFDMDMFFAAVEIKYNPSLADKPVAVGSMAMISTSNYVARKYGVRSAMAGFIAKKLCPELVLINHNRHSYSKESKFIMNILSEYDPNLNSFSLDEVYIDLTDYVFENFCANNNVDIDDLRHTEQLPEEIWNYAFEVVNKIRERVFVESQLTVSAGISCNGLLAKVCTDINKPNGQFMVKGYRDEIVDFVSSVEVRKFSGIGPVRGQLLSAFNIRTGADIYNERATIFGLFSENDASFYMRIALGIGYSFIGGEDDANDVAQKSHSREVTVAEVSQFDEMCTLLQNLAQRLSVDLQRNDQRGRTITLKLKKVSFDVMIKSKSIGTYTDDAQAIFSVAKELLLVEVKKSPSAQYRLIGIKVSNLKDKDTGKNKKTKQLDGQQTISQLLMSANSSKKNISTNNNDEPNNDAVQETIADKREDDEEDDENSGDDYDYDESKNDHSKCQLCDQTFGDNFQLQIHRLDCCGDWDSNLFDDNGSEENEEILITENITTSGAETTQASSHYTDQSFLHFTCPVCNIMSHFRDNGQLNRHIDTCLNKNLVVELTQLPTSQSLAATKIIDQTDDDCSISVLSQSSRKSNQSKSKRSFSSMAKTDSKKLKSKQSVSDTQQNCQRRIEQFFSRK